MAPKECARPPRQLGVGQGKGTSRGGGVAPPEPWPPWQARTTARLEEVGQHVRTGDDIPRELKGIPVPEKGSGPSVLLEKQQLLYRWSGDAHRAATFRPERFSVYVKGRPCQAGAKGQYLKGMGDGRGGGPRKRCRRARRRGSALGGHGVLLRCRRARRRGSALGLFSGGKLDVKVWRFPRTLIAQVIIPTYFDAPQEEYSPYLKEALKPLLPVVLPGVTANTFEGEHKPARHALMQWWKDRWGGGGGLVWVTGPGGWNGPGMFRGDMRASPAAVRSVAVHEARVPPGRHVVFRGGRGLPHLCCGLRGAFGPPRTAGRGRQACTATGSVGDGSGCLSANADRGGPER